jgi:hypothetical protein
MRLAFWAMAWRLGERELGCITEPNGHISCATTVALHLIQQGLHTEERERERERESRGDDTSQVLRRVVEKTSNIRANLKPNWGTRRPRAWLLGAHGGK